MKRKLFLLSTVALLGLVLPLTGCNSDDRKPDPNPGPDITDTDTSKDITVSITAAKSALTVGEEVELTVDVKNNTANKAVTVTSSDASVVKVEKRESKYYACALKKGTAKITVKVDTKTASVDLTVSEPIPEISASITAAKTALKIGEEVELTVDVKNNTANKAISVTSSDANVVKVEKREAKYYAHAIKKGSVTITLKVDTKVATVDLTVSATSETGVAVYDKVKTAFANAATYEKEHLKSGHYTIKKNEAKKSPSTDTYDFNVYSGYKTYVRKVIASDAVNKSQDIYTGIEGDKLIVYGLDEQDGVYTTNDSCTKALKISDTEGEGYVTEAQAQSIASQVSLTGSTSPLLMGAVKKISDVYVNDYLYKKDEFKKTLSLSSEEEGSYTMTGTAYNYTQFHEYTLTYKLNAEGGLTSFKFDVDMFTLVKDGDTSSKGTTLGDIVYEATFDYSAREAAGQNYIDFSKLFYTDYELGIYDGMSEDPVTTVAAGTSITAGAVTGSPTTAVPELDTITITKIEPAESGTIDEWGTVTLTGEGQVTITAVSLGGVTKTTTVTVTAPEIAFFNADMLAYKSQSGEAIPLNEEFTFFVTPMSQNYEMIEGAEFTVEVVNDATCDAAITVYDKGTADESYGIKATKDGTCTVKISSPNYKMDGELAVDEYPLVFGTVEQGGEGGETTGPTEGQTQAMTTLSSMLFTRDGGWAEGDAINFNPGEDGISGTYSINIAHGEGSVTSSGMFTLSDEENYVSIQITPETEMNGSITSIMFGSSLTGQDFTKIYITYNCGTDTNKEVLFIGEAQ